jgi:hypothetical protein
MQFTTAFIDGEGYGRTRWGWKERRDPSPVAHGAPIAPNSQSVGRLCTHYTVFPTLPRTFSRFGLDDCLLYLRHLFQVIHQLVDTNVISTDF